MLFEFFDKLFQLMLQYRTSRSRGVLAENVEPAARSTSWLVAIALLGKVGKSSPSKKLDENLTHSNSLHATAVAN
jgi:hypothetical protein